MNRVIVMGYGIRASGADPSPLLDLGVPVLSSWQAADLVDNNHPMYFGRPGIYGQRTANRILYEADHVIAIGCRLSPWLIGHAGLRSEQRLTLVEVDETEAGKFPKSEWLRVDAKDYIKNARLKDDNKAWLDQCNSWRTPWIEYPAHSDTDGYINSYRFVEQLEKVLRPNEIIVTDAGSMMCPIFQGLHLKPPQRLMTSGCLGEMGCGIPAAIGASFASGRGDVICILGDGNAMMNLQELQTIAHHKLPIKMILFENDGYAMIKGTHRNLKIAYTGVSKTSGVSFPDFCKVAGAFGIPSCDVNTWADVKWWLRSLLDSTGPFLMQVHIDPEQSYVPRLQPIIKDGKFTPARFDQLSPILEAA